MPDAFPGQQLVALAELPGGVHGERPEFAEQIVPAGAEQEPALLQPAERQDYADRSAADTEDEYRPRSEYLLSGGGALVLFGDRESKQASRLDVHHLDTLYLLGRL